MVLALSKGPEHPKKTCKKNGVFFKTPFHYFMVGLQCVRTAPNCVNIARGGLRGNTALSYTFYIWVFRILFN